MAWPTTIPVPRFRADIEEGIWLSRMYGQRISPLDVARVLEGAKQKYVIVGAHAANGYTGRARATIDVDVIVRFPKKASALLCKAFPDLTAKDTPVVTRLSGADGREAIDVIKPEASKLFRRLLGIAVEGKIEGGTLRVPPLEGVLAAKFASMISIGRKLADRQQDATDFLRVVEANPQIDLALLEDLGELVYPGGGKELLKHVADARAGRALEI